MKAKFVLCGLVLASFFSIGSTFSVASTVKADLQQAGTHRVLTLPQVLPLQAADCRWDCSNVGFNATPHVTESDSTQQTTQSPWLPTEHLTAKSSVATSKPETPAPAPTAAPEPGTYMMFATGLLLIAFIGRKK
jgi:hypothetical protein